MNWGIIGAGDTDAVEGENSDRNDAPEEGAVQDDAAQDHDDTRA